MNKEKVLSPLINTSPLSFVGLSFLFELLLMHPSFLGNEIISSSDFDACLWW